MQYIDKGQDREMGKQITEAYLNNIYILDEKRYPVDYTGSFKTLPNRENSYYRQMTQVLLSNQSHYCCYCMRLLTGENDTTLEHIIPQKVKEQDVYFYQREELPVLTTGIKLSNQFSKEQEPTFDQLPHTVCYDNLVASCHGRFPVFRNGEDVENDGYCCNHRRGLKHILPLYFFEGISSIITYDKNGSIIAVPGSRFTAEADSFILSTQLSWQTLTDIRALWYVLRNVDIDDIKKGGEDTESRVNLILDNFYLEDNGFTDKYIKGMKDKFTKDSYWKYFLLYEWFYTYYRNTI